MMKIYRDHFYKNYIILFFLIFSFMMASCSKNGNIQFCEGTDKKGNPVECGSVFTTGDITVIIKSKNSFISDKIRVKAYNLESGSAKPEFTIWVGVVPGENTARADMSFYNPGEYKLIAETIDGKKINTGKIEIINDLGIKIE